MLLLITYCSKQKKEAHQVEFKTLKFDGKAEGFMFLRIIYYHIIFFQHFPHVYNSFVNNDINYFNVIRSQISLWIN